MSDEGIWSVSCDAWVMRRYGSSRRSASSVWLGAWSNSPPRLFYGPHAERKARHDRGPRR